LAPGIHVFRAESKVADGRDKPDQDGESGSKRSGHAVAYCWSMIFSENRCPPFGTMLHIREDQWASIGIGSRHSAVMVDAHANAAEA
jgi:hypothetical protein